MSKKNTMASQPLSLSENKYVPWVCSIAIHVIIFAVLAAAGVFTMASREQPSTAERVVDVVLYDADAGSGGGGGSPAPGPLAEASAISAATTQSIATPAPLAQSAAAPSVSMTADTTPATMPDIVLNEADASQETADADTEMAAQGANESPATSYAGGASNGSAQSGAVNTAPDGIGSGGTGGGSGGGNGTGNGTGDGAGSGTGRGGGADGDGVMEHPKEPPHLLSADPPTYPASLRSRGIEGAVKLRLIVGRDGSVERATIVESSGYDEMDSAAVEAAYGYFFAPAADATGELVRCAVSTTIRFVLN